jgi:hypothetical protein
LLHLLKKKITEKFPGRVYTNEKGDERRKWCMRVNMLQILCTHECKQKKRYLLKLFQEWGVGRIKENGGGHEFKYDIFHIVLEPL